MVPGLRNRCPVLHLCEGGRQGIGGLQLALEALLLDVQLLPEPVALRSRLDKVRRAPVGLPLHRIQGLDATRRCPQLSLRLQPSVLGHARAELRGLESLLQRLHLAPREPLWPHAAVQAEVGEHRPVRSRVRDVLGDRARVDPDCGTCRRGARPPSRARRRRPRGRRQTGPLLRRALAPRLQLLRPGSARGRRGLEPGRGASCWLSQKLPEPLRRGSLRRLLGAAGFRRHKPLHLLLQMLLLLRRRWLLRQCPVLRRRRCGVLRRCCRPVLGRLSHRRRASLQHRILVRVPRRPTAARLCLR